MEEGTGFVNLHNILEQGGSPPLTYPQHIAIVMDGNGRWATRKRLPRTAGHKAGVSAVRRVVKFCAKSDVKALTLFAFSSENWSRPAKEVKFLMELFQTVLVREIKKLHANNIKVRIIGERSELDSTLIKLISHAEALTQHNDGLNLNLAINYGGHWDITQAVKTIASKVASGEYQCSDINEACVGKHMALAELPAPDLFIRTSGEQRISNFMLWQLAYAELCFIDACWPDVDENTLLKAIATFSQRQRRFGKTAEQVSS